MKSNSAIAATSDDASDAALIGGLSARQAAMLAGILVVAFAVYLPSLRNGWVLDDRHEFIDNKLIHSWSFVWNSFRYDAWWFRNPAHLPQSPYYRPLENVWFAANAFLFGTRPALWHMAKIAVNVVVVALSFRLAQLLTGDVAIGLVTAAIFAVMPAHAEAVVYASAIPQPLSTAFELAAMISLIGRKADSSRGLISAITLYGCALLTHESAVLFPLIVGAYLYMFETRLLRAILRILAPFLIVLIAYLFARLNVFDFHALFDVQFNTAGTLYSRGIEVLRPHYSPTQVLMTLPSVLITYLGVLVIPGGAGPMHDVDWISSPHAIVFTDAAALLILATGAFMLARRSPNRHIYLFCALWIFFTMAPALNLNAILWLVDDRYLYAPSFGWSLAVAVAAMEIASAGSAARNAAGVAITMTLALYAVSTISIQRYWYDDVALFNRSVEVAPEIAQNRMDLAAALDRAGRADEAARVLERAVLLDPNDAHTHLKLAQEYQKSGRMMDFQREFQKFVKLSSAMAQRKPTSETSDTSQSDGAAPEAAGASPSP